MTAKCVGLFDRRGTGINAANSWSTWNGANLDGAGVAYNTILSGFVVNELLNWSSFQATAGSPAGTGTIASAAVDNAFACADQYNAIGNSGHAPANPWTLKIRIPGTETAPTWHKNLGSGPITNDVTTMSAWWQTVAINAYAEMLLTLAAYVPNYTVHATGLANTQPLNGHPLLGEMVVALGADTGGEPLLRADENTTPTQNNLHTAGYTFALDQAQHQAAINAMAAAFTLTPLSFSFNWPAADVEQGGPTGLTGTQFALALSEWIAGDSTGLLGAAFAPAFPFQGVLENNSLRANGSTWGAGVTYADCHGPGYTNGYAKFAQYNPVAQANTDLHLNGLPAGVAHGARMFTQTSTYAKMGQTPQSLLNTLDYAVWLGFAGIELPGDLGGYENLSTAQLQPYIAKLQANDPSAQSSGGGGNVPSPYSRRHWHAFTHH